MNKICTSLEQSKKLIELGIDENTSDMVYLKSYFEDDGEYNLLVGSYHEGYAERDGKTLVPVFDEHIPAWSLSALLELMPSYLFEFERGIDLNIYPNLSSKAWHCSYMPNAVENMKNDKFKQITSGDNLVDAAFEMICWLKENKKL